MITYSWTITSLNSYPTYKNEQDVVFAIFATYTGTDGTYTANVPSAQSLVLGNASVFTPYADLTKNQVLGWLLASLTPQQIDQMQAEIAAQINADSQPAFVQLPLPWSN